VAGFVIDIALNRVDVLEERIDTDLLAGVGHLAVAPEWAEPVFVVGLFVFRKARIVGKPGVVEVGVRR